MPITTDTQPLILVPTELERSYLTELGADDWGRVELCGFGPIAAAARTAQLLALRPSSQVWLLGIAGALTETPQPSADSWSLDLQTGDQNLGERADVEQVDAEESRLALSGERPMGLEIGQAYEFTQIACFGIGAGSGWAFQSAAQLGWNQLVCPETIGDRIGLSTGPGHCLLTVCAAAGNADDVAQRLRLFPESEAEDMEAFGVACACRLAGAPLRVLRGISNRAGQRDASQWRIPQAMRSVGELFMELRSKS